MFGREDAAADAGTRPAAPASGIRVPSTDAGRALYVQERSDIVAAAAQIERALGFRKLAPLPRERALVAGPWLRDALGPCDDCGHLSNWHYGGCNRGASVCQHEHAPCPLGCREFKGKLRPAIEPACVAVIGWAAVWAGRRSTGRPWFAP